jgi:superfamily I DNA/RNA helicase/RecB family exonuclease
MPFDAAQQAVIDSGPGALCVLGGPGTGKTTVLEERFIRLARSADCSPDRILFLVPNRPQKLALQNRLTHRLLFEEGLDAVVEVPVYTWHGLANHLVTRHYRRLAYPEPPVLLTSPEQWGEIRDALAGESAVNWPHYKSLLGSAGFVDEVVDFCIRAAQRLMDGAQLDALIKARPEYEEIVRFYLKHRKRLRDGARVDYPTLLEDAAFLVASHDDVRLSMHGRFKHILVDDAQELSFVQQRLLSFLAGLPEPYERSRSVVAAADPDSAIETFRGADPAWLERFDELLPGGKTVVLPSSYRLGAESGPKAVDFVRSAKPSAHRPRAFLGDTTFEVHRFQNLAAEVEAVARALRHAHISDGVDFGDMAVLLTSPTAMLPSLERALGAVEVPYSISVPDRPLEGEPAIRAIRNLADLAFDGEAENLDELLRSPLIGLADQHVRELERIARLDGRSLADTLTHLPPDVDDVVRERTEELVRLRDVLAARQRDRADEAFWALWSSASHYRDLEKRASGDASDPAHRELDALVAFERALGRFVERRRGRATLSQYLEAIGRADFGADPWLPPQRAHGGVQILSFHASKGKQWSVVAVCGCVEGAIPKGRRAKGLFDPYFLDERSPVERARKNEAEDRRVFFVAVTRATRRCLVSTSPGPSRKGRPSRFLAELTGETPEVEGAWDLPPLTLGEAAARHRRVLADTTVQSSRRVAALHSIARICTLDPNCAAADPREWWWRWDWTEGTVPIPLHSRDDEHEDGRVLRTSYSRISKYDNCALAYLCSVVLGLDPDTSHNMAFGTWIHQIFEDCEKDPSPEAAATGRRRLTNLTMVFERFDELFDSSVFPNRAIARQFYRDGKVMLERYCKLMKPGRSVLAEHRFEVGFNGHLLTGRIDRVDKIGKDIVVSDYKTSRRPLHYDDARESLQLAIYYLAALSDPEIARHGKPVSMQLVYPAELSSGKPAARCQTPEEADRALKRLPRLIDGILAEDFRPNPEADCTWCKFKPLCPLWPEGKELPA